MPLVEGVDGLDVVVAVDEGGGGVGAGVEVVGVDGRAARRLQDGDVLEAGLAEAVGGELGRAADVGRVVGSGRDGRDPEPGEEVGEDPVALAIEPAGEARRHIHRTYATGVAGDVDAVRSRLESIAEELADLALDRLREAVAAGAEKTSPEERLITRARRSVEKAVVLLGQVEEARD